MRAEPGKPLSDDDVERLISAEMTAGLEHVFGADNIAAERDRNYDYYRGVMNDLPAPPGRSRVVENTVANYIGLMKPNLLRIFTAGRNVAEYVSPKPDLQPVVRLVTRFINDVVFRKDNRGELLLGDWAEDALVQSVGSNVNLWGGYINSDLQMLEQAAKGYQSLVVSGDAVIGWTNYATGNTGAAARLKLTGAPSAAATLTFPAYHNFISVENTTSQTITIKCSGGTGVAVPASAKVLLYCDGVDYYNAAPNVLGAGNVTVSGKISGVTAGTAGTDAVNRTQMESAIATAGLPATAGAVLVSASDTTAGYLSGKLVAGIGLALSDSGMGNATLTASVNTAQLEEFLALTGKITATLSSGTTTMTARRRYRISSAATGTLPTMVPSDFVIVEFANGAGVTATVARNLQTIDGVAEDDIYIGDGMKGVVIRYDYASAGAVTSRFIESIP